MFQDFREIDASLASQPAALTSEDDTGNAGITSAFFSDESWTNSWQIQAWNTSSNIASVGSDATMAMYNSLNNVYLGGFILYNQNIYADASQKSRRMRPQLTQRI